MSTNFLFSKVCCQRPAMFCLYTLKSKLSRPWFEFSLKVKVLGLNPGYLLKSVLLYLYSCQIIPDDNKRYFKMRHVDKKWSAYLFRRIWYYVYRVFRYQSHIKLSMLTNCWLRSFKIDNEEKLKCIFQSCIWSYQTIVGYEVSRQKIENNQSAFIKVMFDHVK